MRVMAIGEHRSEVYLRSRQESASLAFMRVCTYLQRSVRNSASYQCLQFQNVRNLRSTASRKDGKIDQALAVCRVRIAFGRLDSSADRRCRRWRRLGGSHGQPMLPKTTRTPCNYACLNTPTVETKPSTGLTDVSAPTKATVKTGERQHHGQYCMRRGARESRKHRAATPPTAQPLSCKSKRENAQCQNTHSMNPSIVQDLFWK